MLSSTIDTKESRYIIVTDIPGVFLHTDMEANVYITWGSNHRVNCQNWS